MVHHVVYLQLAESTDERTVEEMVRASRSWLLKIPEVMSVRSGRGLDPDSQWQFFYSFEVDSLEKLNLVKQDGYHLKFIQQFIEPNTGSRFEMNFELDPSRELKYS